MINSNLETFLGKPVVDFDPEHVVDATRNVLRVRTGYDGDPFFDVWSAFLKHPDLASVRELVIGAWWTDSPCDVGDVVDFLVRAKDRLPALRALFLGDIQVEEAEISWIEQGDVSPLWAAFPALEHFQVRGGGDLSLGRGFKMPQLKTLIIETGGMPESVLTDVLSTQLPALEHLELWLGDDGYGCDITADDLDPLLASRAYPRLKTLALRDCHFADELAEHVARSPLLAQISTLDLSLGTLGDQGAAALLAAPLVRKLTKLDLHHHFISPEVQGQLEGLGIDVDLGEADDAEEGSRYVAVSE